MCFKHRAGQGNQVSGESGDEQITAVESQRNSPWKVKVQLKIKE